MIRLIAISMIFSVYTAGESLFIFNSDEDEARYYQIINEIRCPKCTSGSLSSSNAPISEDLKRKIYELIQEGSSDQEIKDFVFAAEKNADKLLKEKSKELHFLAQALLDYETINAKQLPIVLKGDPLVSIDDDSKEKKSFKQRKRRTISTKD